MEIQRIEALIRLFEKSKLTRLKIKDDQGEITLENQPASVTSAVTASTPTVPAKPQTSTESSNTAKTITAPFVGTFYASDTPGNPPFVKAGDTIKAGQTLGIIEAMKMMNEIKAETDGIIDKVLVEDGNAVEFGQPLFSLKN